MRQPRSGKALGRLLAGLVVVLTILLLAAPWLAARPPLRDWLLKAATPKFRGAITTDSLELGWFRPVQCRTICVFTPDGDRVFSVGQVESDRALWQIAARSNDLGTFFVRDARLEVKVTEKGCNLVHLLPASAGEPARHRRDLGLRLSDAQMTFAGRNSLEPWQVGPINVAMDFKGAGSPDDPRTELVIHPGTILPQIKITPAMCRDLLMYAMPVLAGASSVSGEISLETDGWRLPLENPQRGSGSGSFTIHRIDVGGGILAGALAKLLKIPPTIRLADNSVIRFEMRDGRMFHRDLMFGLPEFNVRIAGSVGFDQTLDLVAEVTLPRLNGENQAEGAAARVLHIPIVGTLTQPRIDRVALKDSGRELLLDALGDLIQAKPGQLGDLLDHFKQSRSGPGPRLQDLLKDRPVLNGLLRKPAEKKEPVPRP